MMSIIGLGITVGLILVLSVGLYFTLERLWDADDSERLKFESYDPKNVSKADAKAVDKALKTKFKGKKIGTAKVRPPRRKS